MATERVEILVITTGAAQASQQIEGIGKSASSVSTTLGFLRAALVAIAAADIVLRFTAIADVFTTVQNKLLLVTTSMQDANTVYQGLFDVAQKTRQPLEQTADVYTRLARSAEGSKLSAKDLLDVTTHVNEALLLSGANGVRAKQGLIELAEGLSLGVLQGRQLRSMITDIPELANVIGKKVGVAGSQLFEFSKQNPGKLTPAIVLDALKDATYLDEAYKRAGTTFSQVFDKFNNSLATFLGQLSRSTGATQLLDNALQTIARHFGEIAVAAGALAGVIVFNFLLGQVTTLGATLLGLFGFVTRLGGAFSVLLVPFTLFRTLLIGVGAVALAPFQLLLSIGSTLVTVFLALLNPLGTIVTLFGALRTVILTNPLFITGALVVAALVGAFFLFRDQIDAVINSLGGLNHIFNTVVNVAAAAVLTIINLWRQIPQAFADIGLQLGNAIIQGLQDGINKIVDAYNHMRDYIAGVVAHIKAEGLSYTSGNGTTIPLPPSPSSPSDIQIPTLANPYAGTSQKFVDDFKKNVNQLQTTGTNPLTQGFDGVVKKAKELIGTVTQLGTTASANSNALSNIFGPQQTIADLDQIDKKAKSLLSTISPLLQAKFKLEELNNELQQPGVSKAVGSYGLTTDDVFKRTERNLVGVGNATTDLAEKQQRLKKAYDDGAISMDEFNSESLKLQVTFDNTQTSFGAGVERTFLKMQQQSADTAAGIEKVLTGAFTSAEDSIVQFVNTGKVSIGNLFQTIEDDLLKSALNGLFAQYGGALFGAKAPGSNGFGVENASTVGSLFGSLGGVGSSGPVAPSGLLGGIQSLFGFASGGSFEVGAASSMGNVTGVDNRLVAFRARDGEQVTVTPPGQRAGGVSQTFNIMTPDSNSFRRSQSQIATEAYVSAQRATRRNMT